MKKLFISLIVVALFGVYSLFQEKEAAELPVIRPQKINPSQNNTTLTSGNFRDGEYMGQTKDAFYGNIQVKAVVQNGRLVDVQFLQYPNDRPESIMINSQAMPVLKSEAIQAQSAQVDAVSGATDTSLAFVNSLSSALSKAK